MNHPLTQCRAWLRDRRHLGPPGDGRTPGARPRAGDLFPFATLFFAVPIIPGFGGRGLTLLATVLGAVVSARLLGHRHPGWGDASRTASGRGERRRGRPTAGADADHLSSIGNAVLVTVA